MSSIVNSAYPPRVVQVVAQVVRSFSPEEWAWFVQLVPALADDHKPPLPAERVGIRPVGLSPEQMARWETLSTKRQTGQPLTQAEDDLWGELVEAWLASERATMIKMAVALHGEEARRSIQRKMALRQRQTAS